MKLLHLTEKYLYKILGNELDFDLKQYLLKGSFSSILMQVFSMGLNFFIGILLARTIGAEGYGTFTYVFTLLSVICTIAVFGMDDLLVREVSSFQGQNNYSGIISIIKWTIKRVLVFSIIISIIFFMVINFSDLLSPEKKSALNFVLPGIPIFAIVMLLQAGRRGLHQVISGQFPEKIARPLIFIFIVFALFLIDDTLVKLHPDFVVLLNIIAYGMAMIILIYQLNKFLKLKKNSFQNPVEQKTWLKSSFYFFIATIMAVINVRADILMLGWMKSDTEVGIYNVAARFSDFTAFALLIITPLIAPSISRLYSLKEKEKLQQLVSKAARANFIFAALITFLLVMLGTYPLKIFGTQFTEGYNCMLLLCGGQLLTTFAGPAGNILLMTGFEKYAFYSGLAGTIINIALNLAWIPNYGINGAAAATAVSLFIWNGLQTFFVFKKLGINPTVLIREYSQARNEKRVSQ